MPSLVDPIRSCRHMQSIDTLANSPSKFSISRANVVRLPLLACLCLMFLAAKQCLHHGAKGVCCLVSQPFFLRGVLKCLHDRYLVFGVAIRVIEILFHLCLEFFILLNHLLQLVSVVLSRFSAFTSSNSSPCYTPSSPSIGQINCSNAGLTELSPCLLLAMVAPAGPNPDSFCCSSVGYVVPPGYLEHTIHCGRLATSPLLCHNVLCMILLRSRVG